MADRNTKTINTSVMKTDERLWLLLGRLVAGEATIHEMEELDLMVEKEPGLKTDIAMLLELLHVEPQEKEVTNRTLRLLERINHLTNTNYFKK